MASTAEQTQDIPRRPEEFMGTSRVSRLLGLSISLSFLAMVGNLVARSEAVESEAPPYISSEPSEYGIGKFYMGREIGVIMSVEGASWLDRGAREREERPDLVLEAMEIEADWVVADIGAASGYYTFRLSARVPEGRVIAVDIQPDLLQLIEERCALAAIGNVETVLGSIEDPGLPESSVDAVLLVDSYHEFSHPQEMMRAIVRALRPGGRVFLVEFRGEDSELPVPSLHKMTETQARLELEAAGLEWVESRAVLPLHHFLVFRRP